MYRGSIWEPDTMDPSMAPDHLTPDMDVRDRTRRRKRAKHRRKVLCVVCVALVIIAVIITVITLPVVLKRGDSIHTAYGWSFLVDSGTQMDYSEVPEDSPVGSAVAKMEFQRLEADAVNKVRCHTLQGNFSVVDTGDGVWELVTGAVFDREEGESYTVDIMCQTGEADQQTITHEVRIVDVNDWPPQFEEEHYHIKVRENNPRGIHLVTFKAWDKDKGLNAIVTYTINKEAQDYVNIDPITGELKAKVSFDREARSEYQFQVVATDHGNQNFSGQANVTLSIIDINDKHPVFRQDHYHFEVSEGQGADTLVGKVTATDLDMAPHDIIHYSLEEHTDSSKYFRIDELTGTLFTKEEYQPLSQPFLVTATNREPPHYSSKATVYVHVVRKYVPPSAASLGTCWSWMTLMLSLILYHCL